MMTVAMIDGVLESLETAMLEGQAERVEELSAQLWEHRDDVPPVLTERLRTGRARVPMLAFELLGSFAGEETPIYLMRIAEDSAVADIVRWGARRRAGWPEDDSAEDRLTFLDSLHDGDQTLVQAVEQALGWAPPDGEILQEVLAYLAALPPARRLAVVERAAANDNPDLGWFLNAVAHLDDPPAQRLAVEALARRRDRLAAGALGRLARTAADASVRRDAAAAERRLRLHVVGAEDGERAVEPTLPLPAVDQVLASEIDGDGGQLLILVRAWEGIGACLLATVFWNDHWGIKDAWGISRLPVDEAYNTLLEQIGETMTLVEVDLPAARGLLAAAVEANAASGHPLPPVFEVWAPLFHDDLPPATGETATLPEFGDDLEAADAAASLRRAGHLLDHPLFANWFFNPEEILPRLALIPPPSRGRLTDRQYRPLIDGLVDAPTRERLGSRLRRQAWLLDRLGDVEDRDLALAAAAGLRDEAKLSKHPLLRAMIERSLVNLAGSFDDDGLGFDEPE